MNKKIILLFLIADIVMIAAFAVIMYQNDKDMERLKDISETYAKENESLKIDLEMLRKKLLALESSRKTAQPDEFAIQQQQKFKAMREEIQRLKADRKPNNKEREEQVWDTALANIESFIDVELTKKLASFGFKPEETEICVTEYKNDVRKTKDLMLQWYRNEISDNEYEEGLLSIGREFYDNLSASVGENIASITLSVVIPDYEFRKKMFEGK